MQVTFEFAATTRDAVGERRIEREVADGATVADAVRAVGEEFGDLGPIVFDSGGRVRPSVNVLVDGEPARDDLDATLDDGATVALLPAVSGGTADPGTVSAPTAGCPA